LLRISYEVDHLFTRIRGKLCNNGGSTGEGIFRNLPYTGKQRVLAFHHNVPNMVGQITSAISSYHLNIANMVNRSRGEYAYTMIDIDNKVNDDVIPTLEERIKQISGMVTARII
jgi:D-3-phosphoglycerate dehydrogenase / 2-oxoglutarate reductase